MEPGKTQQTKADTYSFDSDVSSLLYKSGRSVKNLLASIGRGIAELSSFLLLLLLFISRNILWVLLGIGLGLGYAIYQLNQNGQKYSSEMIVKANFSSSRSLYSAVDYVNALIASGNFGLLGELFNITADESRQLVYFSVEPIKSDIIASEIYREQYMHYDRTSRVRLDTFWTRTINYDNFKESLTQFDYPYHTIAAKATNSSIFPKLQTGLLQYISSNDLLQQIKKRQALSNSDEEKLLVSAIKNLDSLRIAYNQRLTRGQPANPAASTQVNITENAQQSKTPELDLYDKMLELQDELKNSRKRSAMEKDIIEIYSPFNPVGKKSSIYESILRFSLLGLIISLITLIAIFLYKKLLAFENVIKAKNIKTREISNHV